MRVVTNDAVDGLVVLLQRHIVPNGAQVIPQVRRPRRLDPRIGADRCVAGGGGVGGGAHGGSVAGSILLECAPTGN